MQTQLDKELGNDNPWIALAGGQGVEPRYRGPEPRVLPLHHPPSRDGRNYSSNKAISSDPGVNHRLGRIRGFLTQYELSPAVQGVCLFRGVKGKRSLLA